MISQSERLERYADLAIRVGIHLQPNQVLVIHAPVEAYAFVRKVVEVAYQVGAATVHVMWQDDHVQRTRLLSEPEAQLKEYPQWKAQPYIELAETGAAFLTVIAPDPKLMDGVPVERSILAVRAAQQALHPYREAIQSAKVNWSIIALPTEAWAAEVYPDDPPDQRLEHLWDTVARVIRLDTPDPVQAWQDHVDGLGRRVAALNAARFQQLHYTAPGTDLTIGLPEDHVWVGGGTSTQNGVFFVPNLPTEECFTAPQYTRVEGVVRSTRPLLHAGQRIEDFELHFSEGRIVEYKARVGEDVLASIIETDEGSHYLGEVALVPNSSPVSQAGVLFHHTLFDENASCHLAIGSAYPLNLKDGVRMNRDELKRRGLNTSLMHVDFMIGSAELNINGLDASGRWVPVLRHGEWASKV